MCVVLDTNGMLLSINFAVRWCLLNGAVQFDHTYKISIVFIILIFTLKFTNVKHPVNSHNGPPKNLYNSPMWTMTYDQDMNGVVYNCFSLKRGGGVRNDLWINVF